MCSSEGPWSFLQWRLIERVYLEKKQLTQGFSIQFSSEKITNRKGGDLYVIPFNCMPKKLRLSSFDDLFSLFSL